jgi:hypothetical protein
MVAPGWYVPRQAGVSRLWCQQSYTVAGALPLLSLVMRFPLLVA